MTQADGMTITEASRALGVSVRSVYRYINRGILQAKQYDGKTYVDLDSVRHCEITKSATKLSQFSVTVDRDQWQNALTRLGQLEAERQFLIEYKATSKLELAELKLELAETKQALHKARAELSKRKRGILDRFLR